jgi:hypothetical protein
MEFQEEKQAFNARAKASMRKFLRSKTWEEKVESIERMREASKLAREGMRRVRAGRPTCRSRRGSRSHGSKFELPAVYATHRAGSS